MATLAHLSESIESIPPDIREGLLRAAQYGCSLEQLNTWYRIVWEHYGFDRLPSAANTSIDLHVPMPNQAQSYILRSPPYLQDDRATGRPQEIPATLAAEPSFWTPPNSQVNSLRSIAGPTIFSTTPTAIGNHLAYQHSHMIPSIANVPAANMTGVQRSIATPDLSPSPSHMTSQTYLGPHGPTPLPPGLGTHAPAFMTSGYNTTAATSNRSTPTHNQATTSPIKRAQSARALLSTEAASTSAGSSAKRPRPPEWAQAQGFTSTRSSVSPVRAQPSRRLRSRPSDALVANPATPPASNQQGARMTPLRSLESSVPQTFAPHYPSEAISSSTRPMPQISLAPEPASNTPLANARYLSNPSPSATTYHTHSANFAMSDLEEQPFSFPVDFEEFGEPEIAPASTSSI